MRFSLLILCVSIALTSCGKRPTTRTSQNPEIPITGAEVWKVNGTNFNIEGTACLIMGNDQTLFIVKALCDFSPNASHKPIACNLAKYALDHTYPAKLKQASWNGKGIPFSGSIGVALIQKQNIGNVSASSGWRYPFTVQELTEQK
jgi:hypothetical protein